MKNPLAWASIFLIALGLLGCASNPSKLQGVKGFEKEKYLGKWYEIARLDFRFEKDLNNTTADYSIGKNGDIQVVNRGYNYKKSKPAEAIGTARFRGSETVGELEVSFFGPFYGDYNIIALDSAYQYALIAGSSTKYLWILSRSKEIPTETRREYLEIARNNGFDTTALIWVEHNE